MQYLDLIKEFALKPIKNDKQLEKATIILDGLFMKGSNRSIDEQNYMDILCLIVEDYEEKHYPMPNVSDKDMLKHLIEAKGVRQVDVANATNISSGTISQILSGKRKISRNHMTKLAKYFNVKPSVFLEDT